MKGKLNFSFYSPFSLPLFYGSVKKAYANNKSKLEYWTAKNILRQS